MEYRWIEDIREFQAIATEWDQTLCRRRGDNPFLLSDFILAWWKYYHDDLRLRILVVSERGALVGGLPLFLRCGNWFRGFARTLCYIGAGVANYTEPLWEMEEANILPLLLDALGVRNDWDILHLSDIREGTPLVTGYRTITESKWPRPYLIQDHMNWAINLAAGKDAYLATVSKKLRRDLRSKRRYVVKNYGPLKLKSINGRQQVAHYFDLYRAFSLKAFTARSRQSNFKSPKYADFFREFLVLMDQAQRLDAHVLFAGDKELAISFGYRIGRGFNWVLTGFDYDFWYVRPGYLLIEDLIEEITNRGDLYYNWYGHDRFYKSQWCNEQTPLYRLFLINRTFRGLCGNMSRYVEMRLRSCEPMVSVARKIKGLTIGTAGFDSVF